MAKVKITGHASGSGVITVTAPNTSTDRTITLPDETATLSTFNPDGAVTINDTGADVDFRVESDTNTNALLIDGATGNVGIGRSPLALLHLQAAVPEIRFTYTGNSGYAHIKGNDSSELIFSTGTTDGQERMRIDATGAVTMPKQPAFSAQTSGGFSLSSTNTLLTIPYNSERFDQNADFNTSTYTFTAPVTGKYQFNVITRLDNVDISATYYHVYFTTSNRNYYDIFDPRGFDQDLGYLGLTVPCLADMDANDTAIVKIYQAGGAVQTTIAGTTDSHFSGYLVC